LVAKLNDIDSKLESFSAFARIELGKNNERLEKLEQAI
jgi:hypothetical protein